MEHPSRTLECFSWDRFWIGQGTKKGKQRQSNMRNVERPNVPNRRNAYITISFVSLTSITQNMRNIYITINFVTRPKTRQHVERRKAKHAKHEKHIKFIFVSSSSTRPKTRRYVEHRTVKHAKQEKRLHHHQLCVIDFNNAKHEKRLHHH